MKIKTSEAKGMVLDYLVAKAGGRKGDARMFIAGHVDYDMFHYSTNWAQGGPIIDREGVGITPLSPVGDGRNWRASIDWLDEPNSEGFGPTPLIAAMRCFVASKLGDEVDVPDELIS